jgi:hypothetical protein
MLKDPYFIGLLIAFFIVVAVGYTAMTIFVGFVSSLHKEIEEDKKRKKEKDRNLQDVA